VAAGTYKYICEDCGNENYFKRQERISRFGMRCRYCGSRYLEPSKASIANDAIAKANDARNDQKIKLKKECNFPLL